MINRTDVDEDKILEDSELSRIREVTESQEISYSSDKIEINTSNYRAINKNPDSSEFGEIDILQTDIKRNSLRRKPSLTEDEESELSLLENKEQLRKSNLALKKSTDKSQKKDDTSLS
jgi:hypothetical protein